MEEREREEEGGREVGREAVEVKEQMRENKSRLKKSPHLYIEQIGCSHDYRQYHVRIHHREVLKPPYPLCRHALWAGHAERWSKVRIETSHVTDSVRECDPERDLYPWQQEKFVRAATFFPK